MSASTMKALVGGEAGGYHLDDNVKVPIPGPGTLLCRVHAVALNPYDATILEPQSSSFNNTTPGAVGGCDFSGTVVQVGEGVTRFQAGDRVFAVTAGLNPSDTTTGAFAEFALAKADVCCRIPETLAFTQAASMGLAVVTAGLALFQAPGMQLPMPHIDVKNGERDIIDDDTNNNKKTILVSGGATATGTMATQLLKIAGYNPIVTCSPANNAMCQSFGASACFDYHVPTCGADIRAHTGNSLTHALDCIADAATMDMCYQAIGSLGSGGGDGGGGTYVALKPVATTVKYTRRDVRADWVMAETVLGVPAQHGSTGAGRPSSREHRIFGPRLFALVEQLLRQGRMKNHPLEIRQGGLADIPNGVEDLRAGKVRAKKLVLPLISV